MNTIHGNGFAPFRFLTPLPQRPSSLDKRRAVGEKNRLKESSGQLGSKTRRFCLSEAKAARFQASLSSSRNRACSAFKRFFPAKRPSQDTDACGWGKSGVFSEPTGLSFSNILGGRFRRLPSMDGEGKLNLQGRFFHYRVFCPHNLDRSRML
jgi:hypothetical protein